MTTKTSILLFYLRLSKHTQKTLRLASWAVLGVVNVAGAILTFMNIFQCQPVRAAWDIAVESERCIPLLTEFICSAPVNIVTDLAILALPIPVLTGMRLPQRQKTILVATFALGIFVTVVDVVRIYYLQQAIDYVPARREVDTTAGYSQSGDFAWNASLAFMWSAVEVNVGITCACIPTLKPLVVRILPAMLVGRNGSLGSTTIVGSSKSSKESARAMPAPVLPPPAPIIPSLTLPSPVETAGNRNRSNEDDDDDVSIRNFLTNTSPASYPPRSQPEQPSAKASSRIPGPAQKRKSVTMDFITLPRSPKSLLHLTPKESTVYSALVSLTLFFLWGFSYGLLNCLNTAIAEVTGMSTAQTLGLTSAYFGGGYLAGPAAVIFVSRWIKRERRVVGARGRRKRRRRYHAESTVQGLGQDPVGWFKGTFIAGLLVYGTGTIMFLPGAVLGAYGGFVVSSFAVGFGVAVLETAANPFLVLCGPPAYADVRLLLAQGVQAVGSVMSGVLADKVFFVELDGEAESMSMALVDVQWTYLGITLLSVLLALFFYYLPLPEVSDKELADMAARVPVDRKQRRSIGGIPLLTWSLGLAVLAQWCYVSAQETLSLFFKQLLTSFASIPQTSLLSPTTTPTTTIANPHPAGLTLSLPNTLLLSHALFALSRFLTGLLSLLSTKYPSLPYLPSPHTLLILSIFLTTLSALTLVVLPPDNNITPNSASIPLLLFTFFEGPIWPLLFSLGLRGQGGRTKLAAACITAGGSGAGVWPFVAYGVVQAGGSVQVAMVVVVVLMAVAGVYPAFLVVVTGARARGLVASGLEPGREGSGDREGGGGGEGDAEMARGCREEAGGESLGQRLGPGCWPRSDLRASPSRNVDAGRAPKVQGQPQPQQAPWENEVLDTSMLQDQSSRGNALS
jgi:fucose permease